MVAFKFTCRGTSEELFVRGSVNIPKESALSITCHQPLILCCFALSDVDVAKAACCTVSIGHRFVRSHKYLLTRHRSNGLLAAKLPSSSLGPEWSTEDQLALKGIAHGADTPQAQRL